MATKWWLHTGTAGCSLVSYSRHDKDKYCYIISLVSDKIKAKMDIKNEAGNDSLSKVALKAKFWSFLSAWLHYTLQHWFAIAW